MMYRRSASAEGPSSPPPLMLAAPVFEAPVSHSHTHSHPHSGYDLNGHPNSFAYPPSDTHPHTHPHPHPQNQFAHSFSNPLLPHLSQNNNNHHHLQPDSSHNHNHNHHNNNSSSNSSSHAHVDDSLILDALSVLTSSGRIAPPPPQHFTQPEDDISALFAGTSRNNPSHSPTTTSTSALAATATAPQPTIQQKEPKQKAARQPAQRPKAYAQKACSSCKNSHVACDAGRPCQRCIRLNRADTCEDASRKKRGRPSNAEKIHLP
ncbi:hypothetical protein BCR33DRAFT_18496 [Rhizoclosmatium globosum]|uniref:Zn(2)-C6 fungal-type domain-containing protein n=1 Tax=Rhizoclosmatium globosum TaxID=329046 RepID=A0A1Y2CQ64_9FUNG|nr:hypothetical protein BCR33DRAFT_18496 [Rhizoclosmatium globosum]|eukprot:ORY49086.1 hypothetical protein BCR33DRAFT_18496 [Rhizoclosmatium globosum]